MAAFPKNINKSWTLFLDRDGIINKRIYGGYVQHWEAFEFLPGVPESLAVFSRIFGRIIVITNQQGIGKGIMNEAQLEAVHRKMFVEVEKAGGKIDAVFHCPDVASKPGNCRKPSAFMALKAKKRFPEIDFNKSIMVGDAESDMVFGKNAGMFTILMGDEPVSPETVDYITRDLPSLATLLIRKTL
ncbi:MAG: D-glycero-alpha-D-manno-heptose-1,7-bisphosphate 7-phosphatase [bacterium]|nr:MAG: D-glycero-alpha-D-manno-heptose-1,7-bisphosphate 7-phosphatase [bacterium]